MSLRLTWYFFQCRSNLIDSHVSDNVRTGRPVRGGNGICRLTLYLLLRAHLSTNQALFLDLFPFGMNCPLILNLLTRVVWSLPCTTISYLCHNVSHLFLLSFHTSFFFPRFPYQNPKVVYSVNALCMVPHFCIYVMYTLWWKNKW